MIDNPERNRPHGRPGRSWEFNIKMYLKRNCKLQTYNKINGAIWRHFGKQMNKETKLRIHNITAKTALKFGSEA